MKKTFVILPVGESAISNSGSGMFVVLREFDRRRSG
jgi:hypothetical protein